MRCQKCHKFLPLLTKFCSRCGTKVSPKQRLRARYIYSAFLFIVITVISVLMYQADRSTWSSDTKELILESGGIVVLIFGATFLFLLILAFGDLIKLCFKRPWLWFAPVLLVAVLGGGGYYGIRLVRTEMALAYIPVLQSGLIESVAYKLAGDQLQGDKKELAAGYSWPQIELAAKATVESTISWDLSSILKDYERAIVVWSGQIRAAAQEQKNWSALAKRPGSFTVNLSPKQAENQLKQIVNELSGLREFGDLSIAKIDIDAMRYLAVRSIVWQHWLQGVIAGQKTKKDNQPELCYQDQEKNICAGPVLKLLAGIESMAVDLINTFDNKLLEKWEPLWQTASQELALDFPAVKVFDKPLPKQQVFMDECYARGGELSELAPLALGLLNTELGKVCNYKLAADNCWDFLTDAGGRYSGGDDNCPTLAFRAPLHTPKASSSPSQSWGSDYQVFGKMKCQGDIPGMPPIAPITTEVKVVDNKIKSDNQEQAIDGRDQAFLNNSYSNNDGSVRGQTSYQFYLEDGERRFRGGLVMDMEVTVKKQKFSSHCVGNFIGRQVK